MATRIWLGLACVTVAAVSATACFVRESDDAETAPQQVVEGRESVISAVVALEGGCTAVKVGPKQLLVAARCVTNRPAYSIGKPIRFRAANPLVAATPATEDGGADASAEAATNATDAGAPRPDAAASDAGAADAAVASADAGSDAGADGGADGGADAGAAGAYEMTIAQVEIHPSFLAKCGTGACAAGKTGGVEVADLAIIVLNREIADLTTAPIDLDPVSIGDKLLGLGYGCDATADVSTRLSAKATSAVTSDSVNHAGSPFDARPDLARELAKSYVVTRGPGNAAAGAGAPGICSERDLGAPIFRADGSSIVGVSSGTTLALNALPMTNEYARVDALSRHNVGAWLAQLGVKTTKTCSAPDGGGCPKQPEYPADTDAGDAGTEAPLPELEPGSGGEAPSEEGASTKDRSPSSEQESATSKKASSDNAGCSAAPIAPSSTSGLALFAAAAVALVLGGRRRRA